MSFAAAAGPHSGRATPSLREAPQQQPMSTTGRGSTYRRRNAVQTNPATSVGEAPAELLAPAPHGLIGDDPLSQQELNIPQTQAEHMIQPDSMADDLGGKAMPVVRVGWWLHVATVVPLRPG